MQTPFLDRFRDPTSSLTHFFAALVALIATIWMMLGARGDLALFIAATVYGLCSTTLYVASGIYHMVHGDAQTLNRLVKYDRVGIFLQIAGTYTPFCVLYLAGAWQWGMLMALWGMALAGSVYVLFFYVRGESPKIYSTLFYIAMGGIGVVALPQLGSTIPANVQPLILLGGAFYLVGALFYSLNVPVIHPRYLTAHDIWHLFVMAGGSSFFLAIAYHITQI